MAAWLKSDRRGASLTQDDAAREIDRDVWLRYTTAPAMPTTGALTLLTANYN